MKRLTLLIVALLILLCGCGENASSETTQPSAATPDIPVPEVTEPPTFAQLDETQLPTSEAVKCYRIAQEAYYGLCPMGEGVVLFSGETETTLTYVTQDNLPVSTTLPQIFMGSCSLFSSSPPM